MAQVYLSKSALADIDRLEEFLGQSGDPLADELHAFILDALYVLTHQPGIGCPVNDGLRELIISRRRSGYLAKYRVDQSLSVVTVLRVRHQRESGYAADEI